MSDDKKRGLYEKYRVERTDGKPITEGCVVLEWKDKNARMGIAAFAEMVGQDGYAKLSNELIGRVRSYNDDELEHYCEVTPRESGRKSMLEVSKLKAQWLKDPCWDIEDTEDFEAHYFELHAFRLEIELCQAREKLAEFQKLLLMFKNVLD